VTKTRAAAAVFLLVLGLWRVATIPVDLLWRDAAFLLALFGLHAGSARNPGRVGAALAAYLLAIYVWSHGPLALSAWGLRP
jgi:hypothetical protein